MIRLDVWTNTWDGKPTFNVVWNVNNRQSSRQFTTRSAARQFMEALEKSQQWIKWADSSIDQPISKPCEACDGVGFISGWELNCTTCQGTGVRTKKRRQAPEKEKEVPVITGNTFVPADSPLVRASETTTTPVDEKPVQKAKIGEYGGRKLILE